MKPNVDLTERRVFSKQHSLPVDVTRMPERLEPTEIDAPDNGVFYTGNARERTSKRIEASFCAADNNCDCCGETVPWRFFGDSLCERCRKESAANKEHLWGGEQMKLCDMLIEAQSNIGHERTVFLEDFDEEGNLITIVRYDEEQAAITIQDTKNRRTNFMLMDLETLEGLDHGKFKRLIDGLFYYAGPSG